MSQFTQDLLRNGPAKAMFDRMCQGVDGMPARQDACLDTALAELESIDWGPKHKYEVDLASKSEDELREMVMPSYAAVHDAQDLQKKLASFRSLAATGDPKAVRAINAIRAQMKLLKMQKASSNFASQAARSRHAGQSPQLQMPTPPSAPPPAPQRETALHQVAARLPQPEPQQNAADWFHEAQQRPKATASPSGFNSRRLQQAMQQQQQQPKQQQRHIGLQLQLDKTISLCSSRKPEAGVGIPPAIPPISVGHYARYGGQQTRQPAQSQQQQQAMRPNRFCISQPQQGPGLQHQQQVRGRHQLSFQPSQATLQQQGAVLGQPAQDWTTAKCMGCQIDFRACFLQEQPGSKILLCKGCIENQQSSRQVPQAVPLKRHLPRRAPPVVAAGRAAAKREQQNKKGDSDDAPIDLADDTDDTDDEEQPQQQQQQESSPEQGLPPQQQQQQQHQQQAYGPAAAAGMRTTRHSSHIVDLLADGELGTATKFAGLQALYPPTGGKGAVSVTADDLERLDPDAFLNDTVIDYYIKRLELDLRPEVRSRFHFFNSFFYKKLTEKTSSAPGANRNAADVAKRNHDRVKSWTKGVDIFSKDYLFVPVHDALHWSLVIICHPGLLEKSAAAMGWSLHPQPTAAADTHATAADGEQPQQAAAGGGGDVAGATDAADRVQPAACIIHLDSMTSGHSTPPVCNALRQYLEQEWMRKVNEHKHQHGKHHKQQHGAVEPEQTVPLKFDKDALPQTRICDKLPHQDNHCDCGLFVLTYLEFFVHAAPAAINLHVFKDKKQPEVALSVSQPQLLRKDWFEPSLASCLRGHLRHQLLTLMIGQAQDKESDAVARAVADTRQYEEELQAQRQRLEQQQQLGEVNPIYGYLSPAQYQDPALQELLQSYKQRQEELKQANKKRRQQQQGMTGAERQRQQYQLKHVLDSRHDDDGALGAAADDEDWEPVAPRTSRKPAGKRKHASHTILSSDDENDQQQQQTQRPADQQGRMSVYGPHPAPPAAAAAAGRGHCSIPDDDDDVFQEQQQPSKRATAAAAAKVYTKKRGALFGPESNMHQQRWQQREQGAEDMQVDEMQQHQHQQQQQQLEDNPWPTSAGQKRQQGPSPDQPHAKLRRSGRPPRDDAGGSATETTSSSSSGRIRQQNSGSAAGLESAEGDEAASGQEEGWQQQQPQEQQLTQAELGNGHRLDRQAEQQLPDMIQGMSIAAQAADQLAAYTAGQPERRQTCRSAAAAAEPCAADEAVNLCNSSADEDEQEKTEVTDDDQQQQQDDDELDQIVPSSKRQRTRDLDGQSQQQQPQQQPDRFQEAWNLVVSRAEQDRDCIRYLQSVLPTEFGRFANLAEELKVRGGVPQQEIVALQDIFRKELDLKNRPRQELLPHLVDVINILSKNTEESKEAWAAILSGNQQQQQQQPAAQKRSRASSAGRAKSAAAAPLVDSKQRTLPAMVDIAVARGRTVNDSTLKQMQSDLDKRLQEEEQEEQQAAAAAEPDACISSQGKELDLQMSPPPRQEAACPNKEVYVVVDSENDGSDSDVEEVGQATQLLQQQLPSAPNPWVTKQGCALATQPDPGLSHAISQRRQMRIKDLVKQVVDGNIDPDAAARIAAGEPGSSGDSRYKTASEGSPVEEAQQVQQQPRAAGAGPQPHGRHTRQQVQQQQVSSPPLMAVGGFVRQLQGAFAADATPGQQQQAQPPLLCNALLPYREPEQGNGEESAVTADEAEQQAAAEVTSPAPQHGQGKGPKAHAVAAVSMHPSSQQLTRPTQAVAAELLQRMVSRPLAATKATQQPQQQHPQQQQHQQQQWKTSRATRAAAKRFCGEPTQGQEETSHVIDISNENCSA